MFKLLENGYYKHRLFAGTFLLSLIILYISREAFLGSGALIYDDNIFVPKYFFDYPVPVNSSYPLHFQLISLLAKTDSLYVMRFFYIVLLALSASFLSKICYRLTNHSPISLLISITAISFPAFINQGLFISGSHATLGLMLMTGGLFFFTEALHQKTNRKFYLLILACILLSLARLSSPVFYLAPLSILILGIILIWIRKERIFWLAAISLSSVGYFVKSIFFPGNHHYEDLGWVEYTFTRIYLNLEKSFTLIFKHYWPNDSIIINFASLSVLSLIIIVTYNSIKKNSSYKQITFPIPDIVKNKFIVIALMLISAALTFGPISILKNFDIRYFVGPTPILFAVLFSIPLISQQPSVKRSSFILGIAVMLILILNLVESDTQINRLYSPLLKMHKNISNITNTESQHWSSNQQVIFVMDERVRSSTVGFNHWSTWYLRYLSGNKNLIGLVGSTIDINAYPFVDKYRDHGPEFWGISDNVKYRKKMLGLELNRPLLIYLLQENSSIVRSEYLGIASKNGVNLYETSNQTPIGSKAISINNDNCFSGRLDPNSNVIIWLAANNSIKLSEIKKRQTIKSLCNL